MLSQEKYNYWLFVGYIILKICDIITTIIALNIGYVEGNPFGFNVFSFVYIGIQIVLIVIIIKSKAAFYILLILIVINLITICNNLIIITL